MSEKRRVPLLADDGSPLFTWPSDNPRLIGAKCSKCGEVVFPKRVQCPRCYSETMREELLSTKGEIYSSAVTFLAPSPELKGEVPYEIAHVLLPERVLIPCRMSPKLKLGDIAPLPIGTPVELTIEEMGEDESGNVVLCHSFRALAGRS